MSDVWAPRPLSKKGNATPEELWAVVGQALSHWERVEQAVAVLFSTIIVGEFHAIGAPAVRAYGSIMVSSSRVQMVREAFRTWCSQNEGCPVEANVLSLLSQCGKAAERRNEIAHGLVVGADFEQAVWFLFPGLFNPKKRELSGMPKYRYSAQDVMQYIGGFVDLEHQLALNTSALLTWMQTLPPKQAEGAI